MNRALVSILLFSGSLLIAQSKPAAYSTSAKDVAGSIDQWEKDTKASVDPAARAQIADDVARQDWSRVFVPGEQQEQALAWTRDVVVKAYLYSVWDRKAPVTKPQVEAHSLGDFISTLRSGPFGFVEFLSAPAGGLIKRDQQEIGRAPMGLIVSDDVHNYDIVLSKEITCESTIKTRPGTTDRMTCPE